MTAPTAQASCPAWCDPSQHITDVDDDKMLIHRSAKRTVIGLCDPQLQQTFTDGRPEQILIDVEPGGWAELESAEEAREYLAHFNRVMTELIDLAWPAV